MSGFGNSFGGGGDPSSLIKMLLARSGGQPQGLGVPFSGVPFSGLPQVPKAAMFTTDFAPQQSRGAAPEAQFAPPPETPRVDRIKTGAGLGDGILDGSFEQLAASLNLKKNPADDGMQKIRDALAASQNALATLYGTPTPSSSPQAASNGSASRRVYNPMQAPDTGEEMPPEAALEQYRYNLGNIRTSDIGWQGKTSPYRGFESFASPEAGARAMFLNLRSYAKDPSMTLGTAIAKWAPKSENDTDAYIASVAKNAGIPADTPLQAILRDPQKAAAMMYAMGQIEHGRNFLPVFTPEFLAKVVSSVEAG